MTHRLKKYLIKNKLNIIKKYNILNLVMKMKLNVIYEDNHIIVVEKPYGIPTQADITNDIDMQTLVKEYIKENYSKPGNVFAGIVHRLDRNVGGIMVFARTSKAASRLSEEIRSRRFKKTYLAWVSGKIKNKTGVFEDYLLKDEEKNFVKVVDKNVKGAKEASLDYEVIEVKDDKTLVKINLHTGRAHQIRVQFSSRGHALIGDKKYGGIEAKNIFLWAHKISFKHPVKDEIVEFELKMPDFFEKLT